MRRSAAGLLCLLLGCNADRVGIGVNIRQGNTSYGPVAIEDNFPAVRVHLEKDLREGVVVYSKIEGIHGDLGTSQYLMDGDLHGRFGAFGTGIKYFPFSENLSFDLEGEVFYSEIDTREDFLFATRAGNYDVFGWGLNVGLTGEFPLDKKTSFLISGGYSFTDNASQSCNFDFDGFYAFIGINFDIANREK